MLNQVNDLTEFDWIRTNTDKLLSHNSENWKGNFISHCVPPFDDYCKVFHPIYIDSEFIDSPKVTWDNIEIKEQLANGKKIDSIIVRLLDESTLVYGASPRPGFQGKQIRWKELAERYGLIFHSEINVRSFSLAFPNRSWPRFLIGPDEGRLEKNTCAELVNVLRPFTDNQNCFFGYDVIATQQLETDLLFSGTLDDVLDTYSLDSVWSAPTYWWPQNRSWCVCTDWDLTFTIIGGSQKLIDSILSNKKIEALRVERTSRVDWKGDQVNESLFDKIEPTLRAGGQKRGFSRFIEFLRGWKFPNFK
jgi:hypothetical protein